MGNPIVCENIFEYYGSIGYEIIFAFSIKLSEQNMATLVFTLVKREGGHSPMGFNRTFYKK